jgi:prepilin-type N-terminal cleavage/methylation domain-containing protein
MSDVPRSSRDRAAAGYTAVEVLMAMTIMAIGSAAVMSMQKASVLGNADARKTDIANSITRTWVERLHRDAMQWTTPGPTNPTAGSNLANAKVVNYGATNSGNWFRPDQYAATTTATTANISAGFDILGRDVPLDRLLEDAVFCAHVRLTWLDQPGLLRADVRVLWARGISNESVPSAPKSVCDPTVASDNQPDPLAYHAIYVTTAVKGNPI